MNAEKLRTARLTLLSFIGMRGLVPSALTGGRIKREYNPCAGCGNPTRESAYCRKCQTKGKR